MGGARVTTLVTLRKCTLGHKREIKTLKFVSASTKGFKGGLSLDQALQERHGSDFFLLSFILQNVWLLKLLQSQSYLSYWIATRTPRLCGSTEVICIISFPLCPTDKGGF